jgi:hypothetical protein
MRGWKLENYGNDTGLFQGYGYNAFSLNRVCSSYSMDLWNKYIIYSSDPNRFYFARNGGSNWTPGDVFRQL